MWSYEAAATIDAEPEAVWAVLTDGAAWSSWDSGVEGVEGPIALWRSMPDLGPSFAQFAQGLKRRVESRS